MARTKTTPRKRGKNSKKIYIIKQRLANPKSVRFGNIELTVRYKRISKKHMGR